MSWSQKLSEMGVLQDQRLIAAFDQVDRRDFLPDSRQKFYMENRPIPIGYEQTNSQPFTVAFMLELLLPQKTDKVLDVGSGSGWTATLLASLSEEVVGVERIPELVEFANTNIAKYKLDNVSIKQAGKQLGWLPDAPYDKIIVSAASGKIPKELVDQLKVGGRMVIPIGESIFTVEKSKAGIKEHEFKGFRFVPLIQD